MRIGIIGFGRLGQLIARYLSQDFQVFCFDRKKIKSSSGIKQAHNLNEILQCDIIVPAVPISQFESVIKRIAKSIPPGRTVIDVCSVKELPVAIMKQYLPKNVQILATHPMFGPDSASKTLWGSKIALTPVRINKTFYSGIKNYFQKHGLTVIETSAKAHDQQIAETLVLTHLIGRTLIEFGAKPRLIDTKGHRRLMRILETVENDSWQLFVDMNNFNPYAKKMRKHFKMSLKSVLKKLKDD